MNFNNYIITPDIPHGKPCIKGTRITVYDLLKYFAEGMIEQEILDSFSSLSHKNIQKFPNSHHIDFLKMQGRTNNIWDYTKTENYIISKNNYFHQQSFLFAYPPQVIWLSIRNSGMKIIAYLLLKNLEQIEIFKNSSREGLLELTKQPFRSYP